MFSIYCLKKSSQFFVHLLPIYFNRIYCGKEPITRKKRYRIKYSPSSEPEVNKHGRSLARIL